jgi:hypothetical protein
MLYREYAPAKIFVSFTNYPEWRRAADDATQRICRWFDEHPNEHGSDELIEKKVYSALKEYLKDYFENKCAYCESFLDVVGWKDVDHFRPKLRVSGNPGHRGYYWLAYRETNLVPSCERCNRGGKRDNFPVEPESVHSASPESDLLLERPLLLCPYDSRLQDPDAHFRFEFEELNNRFIPTGHVSGISDHAKELIRICKLDRGGLVTSRRVSQEHAIDKLKNALGNESLLDMALDELWATSRQHVTAIRATCIAYLDFQARLNQQKIKARKTQKLR